MWINAVDSTVGFCQFKSVIDDDLDNDLNDDLDLIADRLFWSMMWQNYNKKTYK